LKERGGAGRAGARDNAPALQVALPDLREQRRSAGGTSAAQGGRSARMKAE
jgi:hypothetical protein